jgi:uncharacterized protein YndB with AHSA1/START domain
MNQSAVSDRIEREVIINAQRGKVWQALTDARQFGAWFGVILSGPFTQGGRVQATVTGETMTGYVFDIFVERMDPERFFSWRWLGHEVEPGTDTSREPTTLVEFHLDAVAEGTRLRVVESGFDQVPADKRLQAFRNNSEGWTIQVANIERYVTTH